MGYLAKLGFSLKIKARVKIIAQTSEPFAKLRFSFKIKACEKFYHRHIIDIPRIKF